MEQCLGLESGWVGYHPVTSSVTLVPIVKWVETGLLGGFSKIILAMHLNPVQCIVGSQYMSTVILTHIFFLSDLVCF